MVYIDLFSQMTYKRQRYWLAEAIRLELLIYMLLSIFQPSPPCSYFLIHDDKLTLSRGVETAIARTTTSTLFSNASMLF